MAPAPPEMVGLSPFRSCGCHYAETDSGARGKAELPPPAEALTVFFDTPIYIIFLAVVVVVYWRLSWRRQNGLLLAASYLFYGWWDLRFLALIGLSTVVDFLCASAIAASDDVRRRRLLLTISLAVNLGALAFFKYFNFFVESFTAAMQTLGVQPTSMAVIKVLLPPGISFYTFQEIAYIVDVYQGKLKPARSLLDYALFISLFPHLIAGPIQRPDHLLPQVQSPRTLDHERVFSGLLLILSGLFRKAVIADNCALLADAAFSGRLGAPNLAVVAIGTYAFAWQIYGDFSGYSDIARGSAQLLGFHFMVNFRQPYLATSLQDFWRRWHISLSTWLRDYLYVPLGGNRDGERRTYRNLLLTMVIGGLWHGANWTFVVWGALHGVGLSIERAWRGVTRGQIQDRMEGQTHGHVRVWAARIIVFHLVCLAWVFFRAQSLGDAVAFLGGLGKFVWQPEYAVAFQFLAVFSLPLFLIDILNEQRADEYVFASAFVPRRVAVGIAMMALVALFAANQINAFIYFQF